MWCVIKNAAPSGVACNGCSRKSFTNNVFSSRIWDHGGVSVCAPDSNEFLKSPYCPVFLARKAAAVNKDIYRKVLHVQCVNKYLQVLGFVWLLTAEKNSHIFPEVQKKNTPPIHTQTPPKQCQWEYLGFFPFKVGHHVLNKSTDLFL